MDIRSHFPVLERTTYLNAGSVGPVPREAVEAARAELVACSGSQFDAEVVTVFLEALDADEERESEQVLVQGA